MKKIVILVALLALAAVGALLTVKSLTSGLAATADSFFHSVAQGDMDTAAGHLSTAFTETHSREELAEFLERSSLTHVKAASWDVSNYTGDTGELRGVVFTESGAVVPVRLTFVQEHGAWRIHALDAVLPTLNAAARSGSAPDLDTLEGMVRQALAGLALAVKTEDFARFHQGVSAAWRARTTPADLAAAFAPFVQNGRDLSPYAEVRPVFSATPAIGDDGVLRLRGYAPRPEGRLNFEMDYVFEYPAWKLTSVRLTL
ncbi:MAG: hypothetical protein AB7D57_12275 [Desulfovibrionaceae bacterium]